MHDSGSLWPIRLARMHDSGSLWPIRLARTHDSGSLWPIRLARTHDSGSLWPIRLARMHDSSLDWASSRVMTLGVSEHALRTSARDSTSREDAGTSAAAAVLGVTRWVGE